MSAGCDDDEVLLSLLGQYGLIPNSNTSALIPDCLQNSTGADGFTDHLMNSMHHFDEESDVGQKFYAYFTPAILIVGLIGNSISLKVFLARNLSRLSASLYLAALSASDTVVLLTYVLLDWLHRGLPYWPGGHSAPWINIEGVCHLFLFSSYTFRFVSVWLIVVFTVERYIAVCRPLQRRVICTKAYARKIIISVMLAGAALSLYKPIVSGLYAPGKKIAENMELAEYHDLAVNGVSPVGDVLVSPASEYLVKQKICTRHPDYEHLNFVMDVIYGLMITAVPFMVITVFNMIIMRKLINRDTFSGRVKMRFKENRVRMEFTITLLVVSSCFLFLNFPYLVVFCQQFVQSIDPSEDVTEAMRKRSNIFITKTIFNVNYAINFFLYCVTGTYYRGAIKAMITCSNKDPFSPVPLRKVSTSTTQTTQVKELSYV